MNTTPNRIRELFRPYQPSIKNSDKNVIHYQETEPHLALQDYIFCYWRLHTVKPLTSPYMYRVVSDGCIDILFEQGSLNEIFITGFSSKFVEYELGNSFDYVGVRFLPAGFPALYDIPANRLTNTFVSLASVSDKLASNISSVLTKRLNLKTATDLFDRLFLADIRQREIEVEIDGRLLGAMNQILASRGRIGMNEIDAAVSERQLRRLFEYYFGESPKTFSKVIRFQNVLGAKPSLSALNNNKTFYNEGYYDQAHFIKEFKAFYGVTPGKAFNQ